MGGRMSSGNLPVDGHRRPRASIRTLADKVSTGLADSASSQQMRGARAPLGNADRMKSAACRGTPLRAASGATPSQRSHASGRCRLRQRIGQSGDGAVRRGVAR